MGLNRVFLISSVIADALLNAIDIVNASHCLLKLYPGVGGVRLNASGSFLNC